jgi:hypothetical protein
MDAMESCDDLLLSVINAPLVRLGGVSLSYTFAIQSTKPSWLNSAMGFWWVPVGQN